MEPSQVSAGAVRVLIVDDQAPFRDAARMVVEIVDGFDVIGEAITGEAAVAMSAELVPDLILMDVNLPGIDGLEATRQILDDGTLRDVVILVLSTYAGDEQTARALAVGADAFITKSEFGPETLEAAWATARSASR